MWRAWRALRTCRDLVRNADAIRDQGGLSTKASRASPAPRSSRSLMGLVRKEKTPQVCWPQKRSFWLVTCGHTAWSVSWWSVKGK